MTINMYKASQQYSYNYNDNYACQHKSNWIAKKSDVNSWVIVGLSSWDNFIYCFG